MFSLLSIQRRFFQGRKTFLTALATTTVLGASLIGLPHFSHSHTTDLCHGFVPENDMKIPVGYKSAMAGGLSEQEFHNVLDRIERLFASEISREGGRLKVNRRWSDSTVNASAQQTGSTWVLNMYGGLARHHAVTVEGFALVACHELGHHIGGAPKIKSFFGFNDWATNEGGSDYYANLKCLRVFFAEDDNVAIVTQAKEEGRLSPLAEELCEQEFAREEDQWLCKRGTLAGTSVAGLFQDLRKEPTAPDFGTPDANHVARTDDKHPATQCRMDTYLAGALCNVDVSNRLSNSDYRQGSCVENVAKLGFRPRCWFAP
ncbi:MAG: hypothetical protein RBT63_04035 [Bdellovibrionales bacterium]|jgi:hypothetical protein|nr:hypothetical protein [Bdellovibrionales bacterium]